VKQKHLLGQITDLTLICISTLMGIFPSRTACSSRGILHSHWVLLY